MHLRRNGYAGDFQECGSDVNQGNFRGHALARHLILRKLQQQGDLDGLIIKKNSVALLAMSAERVAVIGRDQDGSILV